MLTFILLLVCIGATVGTDLVGEPPNYLVALLGTAAGAFFTALSSDQNKRNADARAADRAADRVELKAEVQEETEGHDREQGQPRNRIGGDDT